MTIVFFILYSIILLLVQTGFDKYIEVKRNRCYPTIGDFLEYEEYLYSEAYSSVPKWIYEHCNIIVLDAEYEKIYTSDNHLWDSFDRDDLIFISDYYEDSFYEVLSVNNDDHGEEKMIVIKKAYVDEKETIIDYCLLDRELNILSGELFGDRTRLTEIQFKLLQGYYSEHTDIEKYSYLTNSGEQRTLIFFTESFEYDHYMEYINKLEYIRFLTIPVAFIIIILFSLMLRMSIKKAMKPLNEAIIGYGSGKIIDIEGYRVPDEMGSILENFELMRLNLERSKEETERTRKNQQRVLADISHDIKTPLTVIEGYIKALNDNMVAEEERNLYYQVIYERAAAMEKMTNELVDLTKFEHPEFHMLMEEVDVCEHAREFFIAKYAEIETEGFELDLHIPEKEIITQLSPDLFRRVFDNIITNSLKHNSRGTKIYFSIEEKKDGIEYIIGDNGRGIPEDIRDNIFEPFVSGDSARTTGSGHGLGLSIVRMIVEQHEGSIELKYPADMGLTTEFIVRIIKKN